MKIEVNGIKIHYELSGMDGAPVLMMSHSLSSSMDMWEPQLTPLGNRFSILRYDTRGHGASDVPDPPYTLEQLAADAIGLIDSLNIEKVIWVGLSMGGMIGQAVALNYSERLQALVLSDTAAVVEEEAQPVWEERINTAKTKGMEALANSILERWFTPPFLKQNPPEVAKIRKQILSTPVQGFVGCAEAIRRLDYLNRLHEISLPTLIMVGEYDNGTPLACSEAMHRQIPGSILSVIPNAAHLSNVEQPTIFNRLLSDFLNPANP